MRRNLLRRAAAATSPAYAFRLLSPLRQTCVYTPRCKPRPLRVINLFPQGSPLVVRRGGQDESHFVKVVPLVIILGVPFRPAI